MAARPQRRALVALLALALGTGACSSSGGGAASSSAPSSTTAGDPTATTTAPAPASRDRFAVTDLGGDRFTVTDRRSEPVEFGAEDRTDRPDGWPDDLDVLNVPGPSMQPAIPPDGRVVFDQTDGVADVVQRGDVVLITVAVDGREVDVVRRVVAVAGDRVGIVDERLTLDGQVLDEPYTDGTASRPCAGLPDGSGIGRPVGAVVPSGQVAVLGDNRENSLDSRCYGPVDRAAILGRAIYVVFPASAVGPL